jgi:ABC-2 type transport system permease protein
MGAKRVLEASFRIAWKDLKELQRNKLGLLMLVLMPILMMAMIGYIYPSGSSYDMSNLKVQVINLDTGYMNTSVSDTFASAVNTVNEVSVNMQFSNGTTVDALTDSIQRGDVDAGIIIPVDFTECALTGKQANITIVSDNSNPQLVHKLAASFLVLLNDEQQVAQSKLVLLNITSTKQQRIWCPTQFLLRVLLKVIQAISSSSRRE